VNIPHAGTFVPSDILISLTDEGRLLRDTDWHIPELYECAIECGATVLAATHSRYVVDLNRPPDGASLYPGQTTTGLCATETFLGDTLYNNGLEPTSKDIEDRVETYWAPYHRKLQQIIDETKATYGHTVLWDAHSINNRLPRLFDGRLPDLNFGTNAGNSCSLRLSNALEDVVGSQDAYDFVVNGRFSGGYITRHYGRPDADIHAVQLELSQATYMNQDPPFEYRPNLAAQFIPLLKGLLTTARELTV